MSAAESPEPSALERARHHAEMAVELLDPALIDGEWLPMEARKVRADYARIAHAHAATGALWLALWERTHPR